MIIKSSKLSYTQFTYFKYSIKSFLNIQKWSYTSCDFFEANMYRRFKINEWVLIEISD